MPPLRFGKWGRALHSGLAVELQEFAEPEQSAGSGTGPQPQASRTTFNKEAIMMKRMCVWAALMAALLAYARLEEGR